MSELFPAPSTGCARVALPIPVDRLFDYAVPPELEDQARIGCRVRVSLDGRPATGVIVERSDAPTHAAPRLRPIERVLDAEPALSPTLVRILVDEARAVLCPVGVALAAALPPGSAPTATPGFALTPRGREALRSGAAPGETQRALEALADGPVTPAALARRGIPRDRLRALEGDGLVARAQVERAPAARLRHVRTLRLADGVDLEAASRELRRAGRQRAVLREVALRGPLPLAELGAGAGEAVRRLAARGLLVAEMREAPRPLGDPLGAPDRTVVLTGEQEVAASTIADAIEARRFERFLLHGVTGSGKTEVYLRSVALALARGRQALVLVPEITLTHQIVARLRARFGDAVAVLHSGLPPGQRLEQWVRLRRGERPIAVGARSALFAPLEDLGVLVIDEEHDSAYKNEEGFRYHARGLAARRAAAAGCPLVLGSATPSLGTRLSAERGEAVRLRLSHRIGGRPLPAVELIDLGKERASLPRGRKLILSRALRRALADTVADGGQALLFLNRRGFSTQIACFACGHVERCRHCDIALVYHAHGEVLRCHYCDFQKPPEALCPGCRSAESALLGVGTQRLEEEVRRELPGARIARLDRDVAARRGATEETLRALKARSIDVVVGTQMLAKGHDFPGVRLVGVVNADLGLHLPDFRAAERTFQLLTQVAGRAGRGGEPGRVIVQTYVPEHYAVRPVTTHDYETFYREELAQREALGYPPCGHLAQVVVSAPEAGEARAAAAVLAETARAAAPGAEVLGPAPAPIARLRGRYRFHVLVKGPGGEAVLAGARAAAARIAGLPRAVRAHVDTAPENLL